MNKSLSFCIFIISHGRPDNVVTARTLKRGGYNGLLFIVCDNEDKTLGQYKKNYGPNSVLVFDKRHYADLVDSCDNFQDRRTTTHARNACFDLAENQKVDSFLVLDDDYTDFRWTFDKAGKITRKKIKSINELFAATSKWLNSSHRISSICLMQTGDLMGGEKSNIFKSGSFPFKKRKAMNSFFCITKRRFWFFSRLNEDVNTFLLYGSKGDLFLTISDAYLQQATTQATAGGMSDAYLTSGTYVKSFYTAMICPSFVTVSFQKAMGRIHHKINWNHAVPKIISGRHKKQR